MTTAANCDVQSRQIEEAAQLCWNAPTQLVLIKMSSHHDELSQSHNSFRKSEQLRQVVEGSELGGNTSAQRVVIEMSAPTILRFVKMNES